MKYLDRHPKSKVLRYRRAYRPESLRDFIPGRPVQFARSIHAMSITEPGAQQRFNAAAEEYDKIVKAAALAAEVSAKASQAGYASVTPEIIGFLAEQFRHECMSEDDRAASVMLPSGMRRNLAAMQEAELDMMVRWAKSVRGTVDYEAMAVTWYDEAMQAGLRNGWAFDPADASFPALVREFHNAGVDVLEWYLARRRGEKAATPAAPTRPATLVETTPKSFASVADAISTNGLVGFSGAMRQKASTAIRLWREAHGEIEATAIRKRHVTEFIELLQQRPASLPKEDRAATLRDLATKYDGRAEVPRISRTTVTTHLFTLSTLWNHADDRGDIGGDEDLKLSNPFGGRKVAQTAPAAEPEQISKAELEGIFALPIFTKGERPAQGRGEAAYWLPLLLLWTGARPEEVAQLRLEDFREDAESKRLMVSITNLGEHEHKGQMRLKTDKKATGRRTFPVPQPLIALGLPDYLAWLERSGETVLFPRLRAKGQRGNLYDSIGRWYSPMLKEKGIIPKGSRRPLRELRGNWTTYARKEGVARDAREFIQGHSTSAPGTSANEIYGDRSPLGLQIDQVRMKGLDLSSVGRWVPPGSKGSGEVEGASE